MLKYNYEHVLTKQDGVIKDTLKCTACESRYVKPSAFNKVSRALGGSKPVGIIEGKELSVSSEEMAELNSLGLFNREYWVQIDFIASRKEEYPLNKYSQRFFARQLQSNREAWDVFHEVKGPNGDYFLGLAAEGISLIEAQTQITTFEKMHEQSVQDAEKTQEKTSGQKQESGQSSVKKANQKYKFICGA